MNQFYKTKIISMTRPRSCAPTASQTVQTKLFFFFEYLFEIACMVFSLIDNKFYITS